MNRFLFLFLFILSITTVSPAEDSKPPSVKEFLDDEDGHYDGYVYGLESGLEWASEYYYRKHNIELFCKPSDIELPASRLREMIIKSINTKLGFFKKYEHEPLIGLALRNSYMEEFPCE